ncbi:MaoC family dehydratase [Streptomyces spongiae]|uniref:MaoC family dehydratase n=2 Tax=Streptomyces spongiae TaxID=565072 RepID=A0A5N8XCY2_9ACTN|nr:MaoC family dehydratase [Streptomyces spongiae]
MQTVNGIDALRAAIGQDLGTSEWYPLEQARVDAFADATEDHQWIHVDRERAQDGPFGTTVAHGYLLLALVPHLCWQVFETTGIAMEINYGLDRVRFPAPARIPCDIRARVRLESVEPSGAAFLLKLQVVVEGRDEGKPLCVAETLGYLVPEEPN